MTQILLIVDANAGALFAQEDPRPGRELVRLINTGRLVVGRAALVRAGEPQSARRVAGLEVVTVSFGAPPVKLSPRMYEVLFGLMDGLTAEEIAARLGISPRMVYGYTADLKERFAVHTKEEVVRRALQLGLG